SGCASVMLLRRNTRWMLIMARPASAVFSAACSLCTTLPCWVPIGAMWMISPSINSTAGSPFSRPISAIQLYSSAVNRCRCGQVLISPVLTIFPVADQRSGTNSSRPVAAGKHVACQRRWKFDRHVGYTPRSYENRRFKRALRHRQGSRMGSLLAMGTGIPPVWLRLSPRGAQSTLRGPWSYTVDMNSEAIEQIETKIAFLESANFELSDVVYRQQQE